MEVIIHKHIDALYKIIPEWETLNEEFHEVTVFQDKNWLKSWWDHKSRQENITPYLIEIKEGNEVIGIIPFYHSIINLAIFQIRVLKPIGSESSDYLLPLLSKKYSPDVLLSCAFEKIYEDRFSWDYIEWKAVPEESFFDKYFNNLRLTKPKWINRKRSVACPFLMLKGDIENIKLKFNKSLLKEVLTKKRQLIKKGELKYSKVVSEQEIEPVMNMLFKLHCERWANTDTPSEFRHKEQRDYALLAAKSLFKSNLLQLSFLSLNKEIISIEFGMFDGKKSYLYIPSMNTKYKKYSPSHLLTYHLIMDAYKEGVEIVDFLRGDEEYKQKWGTINKYNVNYHIFNYTMKSMLIKNFYHIKESNHFIINYIKPIAKRLWSIL
ncbi:GNAT family N-acetyltransferase [Bacillus sp. S/N-304-OC-R1]|uniref:GNAT family N-acetyltransferase n=1 Tax=Bacillus sp. S/N-304-OC-R1 TaxID=2758034 RepID=UPI001C8EBABA|nr:GNAT family N-acetyltransferase [Bacillus sp. S/N-304-OC-R1]MBY0124251.1 GNAT family N-acetyltransferase [Bacillus sp. S/N-304-OC-R1]